jgi:hypothetical protein
VAGFCCTPLTLEATFVVKVMLTLPPPGIVNEVQLGTASPTAGFVVVGRVAPPASVTVPVEEYVKLVGRVSETARPVAALRFAAFATTMV